MIGGRREGSILISRSEMNKANEVVFRFAQPDLRNFVPEECRIGAPPVATRRENQALCRKMRKIILIITVSLIVISPPCAISGAAVPAFTFGDDAFPLMLLPAIPTVTANVAYDINDNLLGQSADIDMLGLFTNVGASVKKWGDSSVDQKPKIYVGVGFVNLFQVQYGSDIGDGQSIRLRSYLHIDNLASSKGEPFWARYYNYPDSDSTKFHVVFSPFIETYPWSSERRTIIGIGIGFNYFPF